MKNTKSESGVAIVELALILPLLCMMLLGTIDFGRLFYDYVTVTNAARAGVSYGSLNISNSSDLAMIKQVAEEEAQNLNGVTVTVEQVFECADGSVVASDYICPEGTPRAYVRVTAQKTFNTIVDWPGIPDTVNINQEAVMRAQ